MTTSTAANNKNYLAYCNFNWGVW